MQALQDLEQDLRLARLLPDDWLAGEDRALLLQTRAENLAFEADWLTHYEQLLGAASEIQLAALEPLRQEVVMAVARAHASDELASCVAEDFELIALSLQQQRPSVFVDELLASYRSGEFPG